MSSSRSRSTRRVAAQKNVPIVLSDSDEELQPGPSRPRQTATTTATPRSTSSSSSSIPQRSSLGKRTISDQKGKAKAVDTLPRNGKNRRERSSPSSPILVLSSSSSFSGSAERAPTPKDDVSPPPTTSFSAVSEAQTGSGSDDDFFNLRTASKAARRSGKRSRPTGGTVGSEGGASDEHHHSSSQISQLPPSSSPQDDESSDGEEASRGKRKRIERLPSWTRTKSMQKQSPSEDGFDVDDIMNGRDDNTETGSQDDVEQGRRNKSVSLTPPPAPTSAMRSKVEQLIAGILPHVRRRSASSSSDGSPEVGRDHKVAPRALANGGSPTKRPRSQAKGVTDHIRRNAVSRDGNDEEEGDGTNGDGLKSLHPDLALLYRGKEAAAIRKEAEAKRKAMLEQEEQSRKQRADRLAQKAKAIEKSINTTSAAGQEAISLLDSDDDDNPLPSHPSTIQRQSQQHLLAPRRSVSDTLSPCSASPEPRATSASHQSSSNNMAIPATSATSGGRGGEREEDVERIMLTLRSAMGHNVQLKVRLTTTFGKMLEHFLKGSEVVDQLNDEQKMKARLVFDGEPLLSTQTVADVEDLEEGELIDVIW